MDPITVAFGLAQFAPQIIKWITGSDKAAEAAGQVLDIAETVTGRRGNEAIDSLKADPALALQFRQSVMSVEADLDKAYLDDRSDARKRDVALAQVGRRNVRADVMVALDAIGLVVCLIVLAVYRKELAGEVVALISTIASIFGLCLRDAHQFEFGSSRGSQEKTEFLAKR